MAEDTKDRILELENQISRSPRSDAYFPLAQLYIKEGEIKKACDICVYGLKHHPNSYVGYLILGNILLEQKRYDNAEKAYATAFKIDPSQSEPLFLLCDVYIDTGKIDKLNAVLHQLEIVAPYDMRLKNIRKTIKEMKPNARKTPLKRTPSSTPRPKPKSQKSQEVDINRQAEMVDETFIKNPQKLSQKEKVVQKPKPQMQSPTPKPNKKSKPEPSQEPIAKKETPQPYKQEIIEPKGIDFDELVDRIFTIDGIDGLVFLNKEGQINRSMDCDIETAKALASILRAYKKAFDISFNVLNFGDWNLSTVFMEFGFIFLINTGDYKLAFNCDENVPYGPTRSKINSILKSLT
ncbi:MAG: tetratricopeptide repeat protein [Candidatus Zixiibacteriota bacterium]